MAVTYNAFNDFIRLHGNASVNMQTDVFKVTLHNNYTFNANHTQFADVAASELATGNGYTQQNKVIANTTWAQTNGLTTFDGDDVSWTASGGAIGPATGAIVYSDTSANDRLVCYIDFGGAETASDGQQFQIIWNVNGIFTSSF